MINGLVYKISWLTAEDDITVTVYIWDTSVQIEDDEEPQVIELVGTGQPLVIRTINNGQNKILPVQGKQAEINFRSTVNHDITTFSDGGDNRYYVEIITDHASTDETPLFKGFLILEDCSQPFQPNPNEVRLIASDHLALLDQVPWLEDNGNVPLGRMRIAEAIALALKGTGLELPINVVSNLRHGNGSITDEVAFIGPSVFSILPTNFFYIGQKIRISNSTLNDGEYTVVGFDTVGAMFVEVDGTITSEASTPGILIEDISSENHFYHCGYIDAKTHELNPGESESCLTVLGKLLKANEQICQWQGSWWIRRIDEYDGNDMYWTQFDANGDFTATPLVIPLDKSIGAAEEIYFINRDPRLRIFRPAKHVSFKYNYRVPKEIPTNVFFERGEVIDDSSETEKTYKLDHWKLFKGLPNTSPVDAAHYIRREFNNLNYESARFAVIGEALSDFIYYIESDAIPFQEKDKLDFDLDVKWNGQVETSGGFFRRNIAQIRLYADDGTFYTLHGGSSVSPSAEWVETNSTFSSDTRYFHLELDGADDDEEWFNVTFFEDSESPAIPKTGYITILLHHQTKPDEFNIHFSNVKLTYIPYINKNYSPYTGQELKVSRSDNEFISKVEDEVFYSDSPKPLFKGAFFLKTNEAEIFTGDARFVAPDAIILENGDFSNSFTVGDNIVISSSASNNATFRVLDIDYTVIGDETIITVQRGITNESSNPIVINKAVFSLTSRFYTAAVFAMGSPPDYDSVKPFGKQQVEAMWNQYRNPYRGFSGAMKHLTAHWPDLVHRYSLTDTNPNTTNKTFILIELAQDWKSCVWTGTFAEVLDSDIGKVYDDDFSLKYLTSE